MSIKHLTFNWWLTACIIVAVLFAGSGLGLAFDSPYTVQDDARQHVFWLQRFSDRDLFPNDLIADYFSSVVPVGYKFIYWLANLFGIEPFLFNKILPLGLGVATSIYMFLVTLEIFPVPLAGFSASLLLNQNLWMLDDLVSGTPRAFFYVLFLGFIYYLLRQKLVLCCLFLTLQGLFYPQVLLISTAILCLNLLDRRSKKTFYLVGIAIAVLVIAVYKFQSPDTREVISLELARQLPEFYPGGRSAFFSNNFWSFWLVGQRSGYFPREWQYVLLSSFGLSLPILLRYSQQFSLAKCVKPQIKIVGQILLASLILYLLAHLLLFQLHLPSRYTQHTTRIVIALVNGIVLTIAVAKISQYARKLRPLIVALVLVGLLYPTYAVQSYPYRLGYVTGEATELYQFLQQQPKDILIASLSQEANFIPSLAKRSILVAEEYSIPYHWDYYQQIRQRAKDLISASYSFEPEEVIAFIDHYEIDFWLVDNDSFTSQYLTNNLWLNQFRSETQQAITNLEQNKRSLLETKSDRCSVFKTKKLNLLDAQCLRN